MPVHCWKNMITVATITRRNIGMDLKREPMATNWLNKFISFVLHVKPEVSEHPDTYSLRIFQAVCSCKCGKFSWSDRFSNKDWALISVNSSSINSWSWGSPLSLASTPRASASRPWWTSQRGEKGINSIPNPSNTAGTSCKLKGRSHAPLCCPLPVPPIKFYSYQYRCFLEIVWDWTHCAIVDPETDHNS